MAEPTFNDLDQMLNVRAARLSMLERYYTGTQPLAYLSPDAKKALGDRFGRMSVNVCRLTVRSVAERLRLSGFGGTDGAEAWTAWLRNDMDQHAPIVHREALALGASPVSVWSVNGKAVIRPESTHQTAVYTDAGSGQSIAAIKRWEDLAPDGTAKQTRWLVYYPDRLVRLQGDGASITAAKTVEVLDNPLGAVPVVQLVNSDRLLDRFGISELDDLLSLQDALNKLLADLLVGSEYSARPRRWATGLELEERAKLDANGDPVLDGDGDPVMEEVNPIDDSDRMAVNEQAEGKFGSFSASDLASYRNAVDIVTGQVAAVSGLPMHYLAGGHDNPSSADGIRAAESSLSARAEDKQALFGPAWEQVARLALAVTNDKDVTEFDVRARWADPATRSQAQEADWAVKLHAEQIIDQMEARERLGIKD